MTEMPGWASCTLVPESPLSYSVLCSYRNENTTKDTIVYVYQITKNRSAMRAFVAYEMELL